MTDPLEQHPDGTRQHFERLVADGILQILGALNEVRTEISNFKGSNMAISAVVQAHLDQARKLNALIPSVVAGMQALQAQLEHVKEKAAPALASMSDEDSAALQEAFDDTDAAIATLSKIIPENIAGSVVTDATKAAEAEAGTVLTEGQANKAAPLTGGNPAPAGGQATTQATTQAAGSTAAPGAGGGVAGSDKPAATGVADAGGPIDPAAAASAQVAPKPVAPIAPVSKAEQDAAFAETQKGT